MDAGGHASHKAAKIDATSMMLALPAVPAMAFCSSCRTLLSLIPIQTSTLNHPTNNHAGTRTNDILIQPSLTPLPMT